MIGGAFSVESKGAIGVQEFLEHGYHSIVLEDDFIATMLFVQFFVQEAALE